MTAIFTMLEENLAVPFVTAMPGAEVTVERVDLNKTGEIVAVCRRGREKLRIPVIDLPLPKFGLKGAEWIDAYRRWTELVKTPHSEIEPSQKDLLPLPPRSLLTYR